MAEYIDKQELIGFLDYIQQPKRPITDGFKFITIDEAIRVVSERHTADVIERAKVLDRIKEAKDEIKAYYEHTTDEKQRVAFNACLIVMDELISEVEKMNE